jgi:hypothetical protein
MLVVDEKIGRNMELKLIFMHKSIIRKQSKNIKGDNDEGKIED